MDQVVAAVTQMRCPEVVRPENRAAGGSRLIPLSLRVLVTQIVT